MAATLAHLSAETLGSILDLVDSASLMHLLLLGSTALNNKLYGAVSRFEHTVSTRKLRAISPKILGQFTALTHVSISKPPFLGPAQHVIVREVDLLALPPTLRTLKLDFTNALLCLLETLPTDPYIRTFTPRLRKDLKLRFKNLERITWSPDLEKHAEFWDCFPFTQDLCAWPLVLDPWPTLLPYVLFTKATQLPPTILSLSLLLGVSDLPSNPRLAPTLTNLDLLTDSTTNSSLLTCLPPSLKKLALAMPMKGDTDSLQFLAPIAFLNLLTELSFDSERYNTSLVQILPRSLTNLSSKTKEFEVECLAFFPSGLSRLAVEFLTAYSSTTAARLSLLDDYDDWPIEMLGFPDECIPCMRDIIAKMPKRLNAISLQIFVLIRPSDWKVFPSQVLREVTNFEPPAVVITPEHAPFLKHFPQQLEEVRLPRGTFLEIVRKLPPNLRRLHMFLVDWCLEVPSEDGSAKQLEATRLQNVAIFETLSQRTPLLTELEIRVDYSFHFDHLSALTVPLKKFEINEGDDWQEGPLELAAEHERTKLSSELVRCLGSVEHLVISLPTLAPLRNALPSLFEMCLEATTLKIAPQIPNDLLPLLPRKLRQLDANLTDLNFNSFRMLPKSLYCVNFARYRHETNSNWYWQDLFLLPPNNLRYVYLPSPAGSQKDDVEQSTIQTELFLRASDPEQEIDLLASASKPLHNEVLFDMRGSRYDSASMSLLALSTLECHSRCLSMRSKRGNDHLMTIDEQKKEEEDYLPEPNRSGKKRRFGK